MPLPDSPASPLVFPADILDDFVAADLLAGIFATSGMALCQLRTKWDEADTAVVDFKAELLSEAAQLLLRQPARPAVTHRALMPGPDTENILDFCRAAFMLGQPAQRDFTYPLDGGDGSSHLAVRRVGAGLLVEDNGLGFNMHRHQDELFQLFRRFHTHTEGTRVGPYLINCIVRGNGGRIEVESEVSEGTSFRVYL